MQQQQTLYQIQCTENQEIVLSITALSHEPIKRADEPQAHVPLKALLQLEELAERWVISQLAKLLARRRHGHISLARYIPIARIFAGTMCAVGAGGGTGGQTDLCEEAFDLAQTLADLGAVVGGEVVEGERQEGFHICDVGGERRRGFVYARGYQ